MLWFTKVFRRKCSSCFARKRRFKFDLKHFPSVTLYVLLKYFSERFLRALHESPSLSLIFNIFRVTVTLYVWIRNSKANFHRASCGTLTLTLIFISFRSSWNVKVGNLISQHASSRATTCPNIMCKHSHAFLWVGVRYSEDETSFKNFENLKVLFKSC